MKPQDIQDLKQLIEFLKQYQVAEFDLDRGDLKIRLKFHSHEGTSTGLGDLARLLQSAPAAPVAAPAPAASVAPSVAVPVEDANAGLHILRSPMVGTFYSSPSPGAPPFVGAGDSVEKNQIVCIIEAMKLMNEIESDVTGTIVKSFVTNGQPVEFGQPLFAVRPV
jgi:acetyl-CoA carboxylase biotin carboxyl carrier protein